MESAGVRICREAGGRFVANAMLREFRGWRPQVLAQIGDLG